MQLLALPLPFVDRWVPLPISDTDPDPGLFGPGSVTWRVLREPLLIFAGARALLLQAAHPQVAQGAIDHSAYADDPFGRLMRTYEWAGTVAFGTTAEARAASAGVNRMHQRVVGRMPAANRTRRVRAHSPYSAMDEDLLLWVHATFIDTLLVSHDQMVGGLTEVDRDRFVREWEVVARLLGVPQRLLWPDHAGLQKYLKRQLRRGPVKPGPGSRLVADTILKPPLPTPMMRPFMEMLTFSSIGFLPPELIRGFGIFWTPAHDAAHRGMRLMLRTGRRTMPRRLRIARIYDFATDRTRGKLTIPADGPKRQRRRAA